MLDFSCDYNCGAHPKVLEALIAANGELAATYGNDRWSAEAKGKIREAIGAPNAEIYFLVGGTQTNATVIHSMLHSTEGVICADSGHINVHEAGAIEHNGHKVISLPGYDGKLEAEPLRESLKAFFADESNEHCVRPGMVYITFPTEYGTLYTREELLALEAVCKDYNLPLYIDGARLAYAFGAKECDVDIKFIAAHCDVFYIGGTKVGALCGEAVVFPKGNVPKYFLSIVKQQGALLAKSRLVGVQFNALFTDGLYFEIGREVVRKAKKLKELFLSKGYDLAVDSPTNQQFVILSNDLVQELRKKVRFEVWGAYDEDTSLCRFVVSPATDEKSIDSLAELI